MGRVQKANLAQDSNQATPHNASLLLTNCSVQLFCTSRYHRKHPRLHLCPFFHATPTKQQKLATEQIWLAWAQQSSRCWWIFLYFFIIWQRNKPLSPEIWGKLNTSSKLYLNLPWYHPTGVLHPSAMVYHFLFFASHHDHFTFEREKAAREDLPERGETEQA